MRIRNISFCLILAYVLTALCFACTAKPISINLQDLSAYIGEKIDLSNTAEYDETSIRNNYGIKTEDVKQIVVLKELDVNSAEVVILAEAVDETTAKSIETNLKTYKTNILNGLKDYTANPNNEAQYYIVEKSGIIVKQNYVFWIIYDTDTDINSTINDYIKDNQK